MNFGESVEKSIKDRKNKFSYHSNEYKLKKRKNGDIIVIDKYNNVVADVESDGENYITEIRENERDKVQNTKCNVIPKIVNSVLINFDEYKAIKNINKDMKEREKE